MDVRALRREPRVPFESTVHMAALGRSIEADICDLSRSGCRLQVPLESFGLNEACGLPAVLEGVRNSLGRQFELAIDSRRGEGLQVRKPAVLVRMSVEPGQSPMLDLGCLFADVFHEEEARRLGVRLPSGDEAEESSEREGIDWELLEGHGARAEEGAPAPGPAPTVFTRTQRQERSTEPTGRRLVARPKQNHPGEVSAAPEDKAGMFCRTETITPHAVLVRIENGLRNLGLRPGVDLPTAGVAFTTRFGDALHLHIGAKSTPLWGGEVNVCGFEFPWDSTEDLLVTLTFVRALDSEEMALVGLA